MLRKVERCWISMLQKWCSSLIKAPNSTHLTNSILSRLRLRVSEWDEFNAPRDTTQYSSFWRRSSACWKYKSSCIAVADLEDGRAGCVPSPLRDWLKAYRNIFYSCNTTSTKRKFSLLIFDSTEHFRGYDDDYVSEHASNKLQMFADSSDATVPYYTKVTGPCTSML